MSLDEKKWLKYDARYPEVARCTTQSNSMNDSLACYEYLLKLRPSIPPELYAYYFRRLLQMNTGNVPNELRLKMFEGVLPEDIMYQEELDAIRNDFDDLVIAYRGVSPDEDVPGICWTIHKWVAEGTFYEGRLFKEKIPKKDILLYFCHSEDEGEIIAHVTNGYEIIE